MKQIKKLIRPLLLLLLVLGAANSAWAQTYTDEDLSVTWSMADGATSTATPSVDGVILEHSWNMSSKISISGSGKYGDNTLTKFGPTEDHNPRTERNTNYYVEWTFRPFSGYTFTPSNVSFDAVKCGTGDPTIDVDFTDGTGVTEKLATNTAVNRDGTGEPDINQSYSISTANNASGNAVKLRIYIGKIKTGKQVAFGRIVISGKLNGTKAALETYTVTFTNNDAQAYGTAPAAVNVTQYESTIIPANTTLYKTGYTLTGWNDDISTYAIGADYTPTASVTMHPVFTENTKTLSDFPTDRTVTWYFGKSNGAPDYDGSVAAQVKQVSIKGTMIDLGIKMAGGTNDDRNDEWMDNQQKDMTVPVVKGAVVTAKVYYANNATINGQEIVYDEATHGSVGNVIYTYTYTGDDPAEIAVNVGNQFLSYISVTYPGTGNAWDNFADFSAIINNQSGTLLTETEMAAQGNAVSFGVIDNNGATERVAADNEDAIAVITGNYHSDHGCTNVNVVVPVPGPVKIGVGQCTYSKSNILVKEGTTTVVSKTPAQACWKNNHSNVTYLYYTGAATTLTISGMSYCPFISVASAPLYTITGTISGGDIDGTNVILTSQLTGQDFSATVASGAFSIDVPADTYDLSLSSTESYVISTPTEVTVTAAAPLTINVTSSAPQIVSGDIANAPTTDFTLTFTGTGENVVNLPCTANATSFTTSLTPDTYTMSCADATLSTLSQESFTVVSSAVNHNIYFPETIPNATQQNITVDNTIVTETANNYKSVSNALAAAKAGSISSPVITLTSGQTYREQVIVDMANVTLKTSGTEKSTITFYYGVGYSYYSLNASGYYDKDRAMTRNEKLNVGPARWGAVVLVTNNGNNFKAENIIFENSFNQYYTDEEVADGVQYNLLGDSKITYDRTLTSGQSGYKAADSRDVTERAAAIGFENNPTGVELYNCEFRGSQDTFYSSGKIHVKNCNIIGNTDYIFGGGDVVFDNCDLTIGGYSDQEATAYITANNTTVGQYYIFRDCTVKSAGRAYYAANLGRDWGGTNAGVYYFNLKNEIGNKLSYNWSNMGGAVNAGTANLHIYDFDPTVNANYETTGSNGANVNGLVSDDDATALYTDVVTRLGFTPEHIYDIALDEDSYYNNIRIKAANGGTGNVTLTRGITADKWSTIVLPFDIANDDITTVFGAGASVAELTSESNETTLAFSTTLTDSKMKANQPYAIKVASDFTTATISNVTIAEATPIQTVGDWQFIGTYVSSSIPQNSYFFYSNMLYRAADDSNTIKPFRAYFTYTGNSSAPNIAFNVDGETTSLSEKLRVKSEEFATAADWYMLDGRKVTKPTKGLYIVNGRKVVIK